MVEPLKEKSKTFCIMPWRGVNINPRGYYTPCCTSNYPIVHSNDVSITEAWHHPKYQEIRRAMLNGQWHTACYECEWRESTQYLAKSTYVSARANFSRDPIFKDGWDQVQLIEKPPLELSEIEIDFSNKCNLKCNMCGSHNSTAWVEDEKALGVFNEADFILRKPPDASKYEEYLKSVKPVKVIRFKGGEPFMVPEPMRLLQDLIRLGLTDKRIHFVTNATIVNQDVFKVLNQFSYVDFEVSLDATGSCYQYMRGGSKYTFSHIQNQLEMIKNTLDPQKSQLTINTVYQNLNCFDLLDFTKWFHNFSQNSNVRVSLIRSVLTGPEIYKPSNLPEQLKEKGLEIVENTRKFLTNNEKPQNFITWERSIVVLKDLEEALHQQFNENLWTQFRDWTKKLDRQRKLPIAQYVPEFEPYVREKKNMPDFKRQNTQTLTVIFEIDKNSKAFLTETNLDLFMRQLEGPVFKNKSIFISLSFMNGFDSVIYRRIIRILQNLKPEVDVSIELNSSSLLRLRLPKDLPATLIIKNIPKFLINLLWFKIKNRTSATTILEYIKGSDVDEKIDYYQKVHNKHSNLEIVLHPSAQEKVLSTNQSLMETIRSEGYFAPKVVTKSEKPEKMRINYKYADIDLSPREIKIKDLNHFKGYSCMAGHEHILVDKNGQIRPSACGYLPLLSQKIGEPFNLPKSFVCPADVCLKNDDILISKMVPESP